jgi:cell division protein FtsX
MKKGFFLVLGLAAAVGGLATISCVAARGLTHAQVQILENLPVAVFFQSNLSDTQTRAIADALPRKDKGIEKVTYISREQAYAEASKDPLLSRSLMLLRDNPLSATAEIHYSLRSWIDHTDPSDSLRSTSGVQDIRWNAARRDALLAFEPWKIAITRTLWGVGLLLLLWSVGGVSLLASEAVRYKTGAAYFLTGLLGGAVMTLFWVGVLPRLGVTLLPLPWRAVPLLPTLFGGLVGLGCLREARA